LHTNKIKIKRLGDLQTEKAENLREFLQTRLTL
jgi:hypothetical protein